ncbi:MAG: hypothetical protein Q8S84_08070 [bacterium]|nr:hypothetical protein [bacterium]MDP3381392.1 hypothetical protein [bacterium]
MKSGIQFIITIFPGSISKSNHMSTNVSILSFKTSNSLGFKAILSHISSHCTLCP